MVRMRGNLGRRLQLLSATAGQLKSLERMLDENERNDAQGRLASDSRPSCGGSRSPSGSSSRCRVVHGGSA